MTQDEEIRALRQALRDLMLAADWRHTSDMDDHDAAVKRYMECREKAMALLNSRKGE